jgi:hypothetical protein
MSQPINKRIINQMSVDLQPHFTANGQVVSNPAILGGTPQGNRK